MIDISYIMPLLAFLFLIIAILFTAFLILNEDKLKKTESSETLKRMYKKAFYLSVSYLFIGLLFTTVGIVSGEDASAYLGGSLTSASIIALIYSIINLYNVNKRITKSEDSSPKD